jgi:hypothetical protein
MLQNRFVNPSMTLTAPAFDNLNYIVTDDQHVVQRGADEIATPPLTQVS